MIKTSIHGNNMLFNRKYFEIGGMSIRFDADLDLSVTRFPPPLVQFMVDRPGDDLVYLTHRFHIPDFKDLDTGTVVYDERPWRISENKEMGNIFYKGILAEGPDSQLWCFAKFSDDYSEGEIYSPPEKENYIKNFGWPSLTLFPSDRLWLCQLFARRQALMLHSAGVIVDGKGFLFLGRSEAGKTTITRMYQHSAAQGTHNITTLCDETNILRNQENGIHLYGSWSHGEESQVSSASALLKGVFILNKAQINHIEFVNDVNDKIILFLKTLYRPLMTRDWWEYELNCIQNIIASTPVYNLFFDKSGDIIPMISELGL